MKKRYVDMNEVNSNNGSVNPQSGNTVANDAPTQGLIVRPERHIRPGCLKLGISVDRTGSTKAFTKGVPEIAEKTLRSLEGTISKLDIDLWSHGDEDCDELPIQMIQSGSVDQVIDAIGKIEYGGGGDLEETHATQAQRILDVTAWGTRLLFCRNVALFFLTDDTKLLPSGKSLRELGNEYRAKGVKLVLVSQATDNLKELVEAAGGFLIPISNNPDEAEIKKVVTSLSATLTMAVNAAFGTTPMPAVVS
ncbi:MAG: hypothetical protein WCS52_05615 [bacterium]